MDTTKFNKINWNTGTTTSFYTIQVGEEGNFVYDKTTDSGKFSIVFRQAEEPQIEVGDFINIARFKSGEAEVLTFDSNGLPINHGQYIISAVDKTINKSGDIWTLNINYIELIEYMKGVPTETLQFTNQVEKIVTTPSGDVTYVKAPYNAFTALERLLKVTPLNNDDLTIFTRNTAESWLQRIRILDETFLKSVPFNDDEFNAGDLFTDLFKFDSYIDRTPVLYLDYLKPNEYGYPNKITEFATEIELSSDGSGVIDTFWYEDYLNNRSVGMTVQNPVTNFTYIHVGQEYYVVEESGNTKNISVLKVTEKIGGPYVKLNGIITEYQQTKGTTYRLTSTRRPYYTLVFERKDGFDKQELIYEDLIQDNLGLSISKNMDTYATGVVSEVNNMTVGTSVVFPNVNMWGAPQYDSDERDTPVGDTYRGNWFIKTPTNIKRIISIQKLKINGRHYGTPPGNLYTLIRENEKTPDKYVLEKQEYLASDLIVTNKNSLFWYEQGTDKVFANEYYNDDGNDDRTTIYNIEYEPLIDTSLEVGDKEYQISINQSDSSIDLNKYSKYMNNYKNSMNKPDIIFYKKYQNYEDFSDLIGGRVIKGDDEYLITNVSFKKANTYYFVTFQLNKDFMRRSNNVQSNDQIRANKAIEYSNLKDRRSRKVYNNYIGLSAVNKPRYNSLLMLSGLIPTQIESTQFPQVTLMKSYGILRYSGGGTVPYSTEYLLNFTRQSAVNQIQFTLQTQDNAQIGISKKPFSYSATSVYSTFGDIEKQTPMLYTDPFGEVQKVKFNFSRLDVEEFVDYDSSTKTFTENQFEYNRTYAMYQIMSNLPSITTEYKNELLSKTIFEIDGLNYYKDMLEKMNISIIYNINAEHNGIIICNELLALSRLMQESDSHTLKIYGFNRKISENDILPTALFEEDITPTYNSTRIRLSFDDVSITGLKSVVIATDDNKKLLIINKLDDVIDNIANGFIDIYY